MHILKTDPDGTNPQITEITEPPVNVQGYIDQTVAASQGGFMAICGVALDPQDTAKPATPSMQVVAFNGNLIRQSMLPAQYP